MLSERSRECFREHPPLIPPSPPRGEGEVRYRGKRQRTSSTRARRSRCSVLLLIFRVPFAAVRAGRSGRRRRAGTGRPRLFDSGMDARSKSPASPQRTRSGEGRGGRRAGCLFFLAPFSGLVTSSLGKQRRSNSLSGRRAKPSPQRGETRLATHAQQPSHVTTECPADIPHATRSIQPWEYAGITSVAAQGQTSPAKRSSHLKG